MVKTGRTPTHIKFTAQFKKGKDEVTLEPQPELKQPEPLEKSKLVELSEEQRQERKTQLANIKKEVKKSTTNKN